MLEDSSISQTLRPSSFRYFDRTVRTRTGDGTRHIVSQCGCGRTPACPPRVAFENDKRLRLGATACASPHSRARGGVFQRMCGMASLRLSCTESPIAPVALSPERGRLRRHTSALGSDQYENRRLGHHHRKSAERHGRSRCSRHIPVASVRQSAVLPLPHVVYGRTEE